MLTPMMETYEQSADQVSQIIHRECKWFDKPDRGVADFPQPRVSLSRWTGNVTERWEVESEIEADCHVVGIALQPMPDITVFAARKMTQAGYLPRGSMRVNEPGLPMRGIVLGTYDVLHLHVPNAMVAEYATGESGRSRATPLITDHPVVDPVIEHLSRSVMHAEQLGGGFGQSYADGISLAITAQLFGGKTNGAPANRARGSGLSKWRLKRAIEYMAGNLSEPIRLADIATAAGLSRMHFAAQFRMATGLSPHEYLLKRRIERARELLINSRLPLVEIAFEVGFRTQAHFTTVFARFAGETPNVWRQRNKAAVSLPMRNAA